MTGAAWSIARRIAAHAGDGADRPALTVEGETWRYGELLAAAWGLGKTWPAAEPGQPAPVTAVMAHRHASSYLGILAALLRGHTYVPINVDHPDARNLAVLRKSGARRLVCGERAAETLDRILAAAPDLGERLEVVRCADTRGGHPAPDGTAPDLPDEIPADRRAYILFTSGSTGEPKGVPISHGNLTAYLEAAAARMPAGPEDRFSQTFELTFDLSVHDLMLCWTAGAHLVVPTRAELARPADFIRDRRLTRWFSVPSLAFQMRLQGDLTPGAFPGLRTSLFCGEALPAALAREWAAAAPASDVENWYGPTEATIACARYVVPRPAAPSEHELVPIGEAFDGMRLSIHGEDMAPLADGTAGELLLWGPQVAEGYLDDPARTAAAFVALPGQPGTFYRTGDRAIRDPGGPVRFLGRVDNQVKVRGFRVELGEIEAVLRAAADGVNAIALSWPPEEPSGRFVVAALETAQADVEAILAAAARALPDYMVPAQVVCLASFPRNASGKADRKAVAREAAGLLQAVAEAEAAPVLSAGGQQLMDAIRAVSPSLSPRRMIEADSLMAAGMDSLSFISLTAEIERTYGRDLSPDEVVDLSMMSFDAMVRWLEAGRAPGKGSRNVFARVVREVKRLFKPRPNPADDALQLSHRTNRTLQFIHRFPALLQGVDRPLVLFVGSSGVFRGVSPADFEAEALAAGHAVQCINAGLPGLTAEALNRVCVFVRDCCETADVRLAAAVFELDPMHISVRPPRSDLSVPDAYFTGEATPFADGELDPDFEWSAADRGGWAFNPAAASQKRRPNWERKRDYEVARTFAGDMKFVPAQIEAWLEGTATLAAIAERTFCFVHPANRALLAELPARQRGDRFEAAQRTIAAAPGITLIPWEGFELADNDFMDINHVDPARGRAKLSRQLARFLFP